MFRTTRNNPPISPPPEPIIIQRHRRRAQNPALLMTAAMLGYILMGLPPSLGLFGNDISVLFGVAIIALIFWVEYTTVRSLRIAAATPLYAACASCLYDLSKHEGQRCPECAHPCTREQAQALWQFELQRKRRELIVSRWFIPKPTPPSQTPPPSPPPEQPP